MTKETLAYINIEISVPVSGNFARAEPDVGINEGFFEDAQINVSADEIQRILAMAQEEYSDEIQQVLGESAQDEEEEYADARFEAMRDAANY